MKAGERHWKREMLKTRGRKRNWFETKTNDCRDFCYFFFFLICDRWMICIWRGETSGKKEVKSYKCK